MAQRFVGIDLGSYEVKIVVVTAGLRGVSVLNVFQERVEVGDGEDTLGASIRVAVQILRERGLTHLPAGVALPGAVGSYRVLKFPFPDSKRIAQTISFELDGQFPVPIAELEYDHVVGLPTGGGGRALVVAVQRKLIDGTVEVFRDIGMDVRLVTVSPLALAQVLIGKVAGLPPDAAETARPAALIVDIGDRSTELVAVTERIPIAVRTLRRGGRHVTRALQRAYGFDAAGAEVAKERDAFLPHVGLGELTAEQRESGQHTASALEAVVREIEHTRLWLRTEYEFELTEIRLTGGTSELRGLAAYLQEQVGLPTHLAEPTDALGIRGLGVRWTRATAAVGAALGAAKRPIVQLYDVAAVTGDGNWVQERFTTLASLGIAVVAFAAIDTIVKVKAVEAQRDHQVAELEAASLSVFGEELGTLADVETRLAEVEGADLTAQLPDRGAFELLEMISRVAAPTDAGQVPIGNPSVGPLGASTTAGVASTVDPNGVVTGTTVDGNPSMFDPSGNPLGAPAGAAPAGLGADALDEEGGEDSMAGPVDPTAGILVSDQLVVQRIDIRELKIELKVEATRATAQDRLVMRLESLGCISDIKKGKVRESNEKKLFELEMSHNCFRVTPGGDS